MTEEQLQEMLNALSEIDLNLTELRSELQLHYVEEVEILNEVNEKLDFSDFSLAEMKDTAIVFYERYEDLKVLKTFDFIFSGLITALLIVVIIVLVIKRV